MAARISVSSGECFPSSERRSSPGVGRRPIAKIEYFALCDAPIMPEKCAPEGYSNGCDALVQVLLIITVYSAGPAGMAGRAAAGGAAGAALLDFPHATTASKRTVARRMRISVTWTGFPQGRVEYRIRSTILPERMSHRNAGTTSPVHFETSGPPPGLSGSGLGEGHGRPLVRCGHRTQWGEPSAETPPRGAARRSLPRAARRAAPPRAAPRRHAARRTATDRGAPSAAPRARSCSSAATTTTGDAPAPPTPAARPSTARTTRGATRRTRAARAARLRSATPAPPATSAVRPYAATLSPLRHSAYLYPDE